MLIKSFEIDHRCLKPGAYLHDVKKYGSMFVTTFDLRFKKPNRGDFLTNGELHSIEHAIATFYTEYYLKDKIYFGPMGCQTGFYLVVAGKKSLSWLLKTFKQLNEYINSLKMIPGFSPACCGNYKNLSAITAKRVWNTWYRNKENWGKEYKTLPKNHKFIK